MTYEIKKKKTYSKRAADSLRSESKIKREQACTIAKDEKPRLNATKLTKTFLAVFDQNKN